MFRNAEHCNVRWWVSTNDFGWHIATVFEHNANFTSSNYYVVIRQN
jgi:hypothetical protein